MDNNQALTAVIDRVSASDKPVRFGFDELQEWQDGLLESFVKARLLVKDVQAQSLECKGCEHGCFMPVYYADDKQRAFIVCDEPSMQDQMGRIAVPLPRLQQWQSSSRYFARVIAGLLGFESKPDYQKNSTSYKLGMRKGGKGRRWVTLNTKPLTLEVNRHTVPANELLYFANGELLIDELRIDGLVNSNPNDTGKAYIPDVSKREARKLVTQAMYQDWNDEYLRLKKKYPGKMDSWYSIQIAKMPIAQGRDSNTVGKNMKK